MSSQLPKRTDDGELPGPSSVRQALDRIVEAYTDRWGVLATITLVGLIVQPPQGTPPAALVVAGAGILTLPWLRRDWRFWTLLTALTAFGVLRHPIVDLDNHHFLGLYWLAAVSLACLSHTPEMILRQSARLLIGLVFAFATLWKILSPDFADGSVLTYLLVADNNPAPILTELGVQDPLHLRANQDAIAALGSRLGETPTQVELVVTETAERLARPMTLAAILLEGSIALAFLLPLSDRWHWLRDATLVAFALATYPLLPVVGFAWLLVTMGLTASRLPARPAVVLYLVGFLALGVLSADRTAFLRSFGLS